MQPADDPDRTPRGRRVAVVGASLSGNKGAAAMLLATIDRLPAYLGPCRFDVLTNYPRDDAYRVSDANVTIVDFRAWTIPISFLLALLVWVAARLRLPQRAFARTDALRAIERADVVIDLAGISFAAGRGVAILAYNVMMTGLPLLLGKRTVKASQALGPFTDRTTALAARAVLPRVTCIGARGTRTAEHLAGLGLSDFEEVDDLAFCMDVDDAHRDRAERLTTGLDRPWVVVVPSMVVDAHAREIGIDHRAALARFIDRIVDDLAVEVVLLPHAIRPSGRAGHTNDLPLCRDLHRRVRRGDAVRLIEDDLNPRVLRAVIGAADLLVTGRFHGMVSGLATCTPLLVISWSHKYREVLEPFGLGDVVVGVDDLDDTDALAEQFRAVFAARDAHRRAIGEHLPAVRERAERNFALVAEAVR